VTRRKKQVIGHCHLCGDYGELTFEHVPPRAAFNNRPVIPMSHDQVFQLRPEQAPKGPIQQRGMGDYTLCASCNNRTGGWYGTSFVDWCYEGLTVLRRTGGNPTLYHVSYSYPLRILKQIATMFFSVCSEGFRAKNDELVRFVLNPWITGLSPKYRFITYYNLQGRLRYSGPIGLMDIYKGTSSFIAEISFPPFGYVLTLDSPRPDKRLVDISSFSRYGYNELSSISRRFPVLPTYMPMPGDYRHYDPALQGE
jgi:hypothetical protein